MQQPIFNLNRFVPLLDSLMKHPAIISVSLISRDGLMVSQGLPKAIDERLAAPMAAAFTGTGEQLADQFRFQETRAVVAFGKRHDVICIPTGCQFIIIAYIHHVKDNSKIITRLRRVATRIRKSVNVQ